MRIVARRHVYNVPFVLLISLFVYHCDTLLFTSTVFHFLSTVLIFFSFPLPPFTNSFTDVSFCFRPSCFQPTTAKLSVHMERACWSFPHPAPQTLAQAGEGGRMRRLLTSSIVVPSSILR
jgi:hypothetical protein